ncbi:MAG: glycosyltransferase [Marinilabiliaceae bacterium]|nr:glycosyltransferase [Marinilabiliaceae bacterium]
MSNPKISVIIPIYNDELYLTDALKSVQQQTFTDFECICINDGSTDKSENIIDNFVNKDSRFLKINKENGGVSSARNAGLNNAKGEYIFFMDHDDLIPDYTLEIMLNNAHKYNTDMVRGRCIMIPENLKLEQLPKADEQINKQRFFNNPLSDFPKYIRGKKYKSWCWIWMCLYKRSAIENIFFIEELRAGGEDNLFLFEVISKIKDFVQIDDITACHRYSKTSATLNGYTPTLIKMFEVIVPHIYKNYATTEGVDKRLLHWVYKRESYAVYRLLIRNTIRVFDKKYLYLARDVLIYLNGTPEFYEITKRWNFLQKIYFRMFINEKFELLKKIKLFMQF